MKVWYRWWPPGHHWRMPSCFSIWPKETKASFRLFFLLQPNIQSFYILCNDKKQSFVLIFHITTLHWVPIGLSANEKIIPSSNPSKKRYKHTPLPPTNAAQGKQERKNTLSTNGLPPKISKSKEEKAEDRAIKIAHLCLTSHLSPSLPIHLSHRG